MGEKTTVAARMFVGLAVVALLGGCGPEEDDEAVTAPVTESPTPSPSPSPTPESVYQVAPDCGPMPGNDELVIMVTGGEVNCDQANAVITEFLQIGDDGDDIPGVEVGDYHCGTADGPGNATIYDTFTACAAEDGRTLSLWPADSPVPAGDWANFGSYSATINTANSYDYVFTSPGGEWICGILVTDSAGGPGVAGCHGSLPDDAVADGPVPDGEANTVLVGRGDEAIYASYGDLAFGGIDQPQTLAYGQVLAAHGVGCTVVEESAGETIICLNGENGFVVAPGTGELF